MGDRDFSGSSHNRPGTETAPADPSKTAPADLAELIGLWPDLDPDTRRRLLALARARKGRK